MYLQLQKTIKLTIMTNKLIPFIFLFLFSACKKEDYNLVVGTIQGVAKPEGTQIIFDRGDKQFETVSGENGVYSIQNLETGIYNIYFTKKGYFSFKKFGLQFLGGPSEINIIGSVILEKNPNAKLTLRLISFENYQRVVVSGVVIPNSDEDEDQAVTVRWFLSDKSDVSSKNFMTTNTSYFQLYNNAFTTDFFLSNDYFSNNSTVYLVGYFSGEFADYYDWDKEENVVAISKDASNAIEFKLPSDFFND